MRFIYLVQGDKAVFPYLLPPGRDFFYLQWQPKFHPQENSFHFPGSSWAEGRNELYRQAKKQGPYDYYIFLDDDVSFDYARQRFRVRQHFRRLRDKLQLKKAWNLWRTYKKGLASPPGFVEFENLLTECGSLLGHPNYPDHWWNHDFTFPLVDGVALADHCMIGIHHSVIDELLPYSTEYDDQDWWKGCVEFHQKAARLYPGRVHRFSRMFIWNLESRDYPRPVVSNTPPNRIGTPIIEPLPELPPPAPRAAALDVHSAVVVTSIASTTPSMESIGQESLSSQFRLIVIGDAKSPPDAVFTGADFWPLEKQQGLPFKLAAELPQNHYSRKNLGYLLALGAREVRFIIETDDDNMPLETFWEIREREHDVDSLAGQGWVNAYSFFSNRNVWPRGFPLEHIKQHRDMVDSQSPVPRTPDQLSVTSARRSCLVQQGLVQGDPDVDAIFRLTHELPVHFFWHRPVFLEPGLWCPFNSQNTTWSAEVARLMYLPSHCPMRETDIWRGLIAQRILWTLDAGVMFHEATVSQIRNTHDLKKDLAEEQRLYAYIGRVAERLGDLSLQPGHAAQSDNLRRCYAEMVRLDVFPEQELRLVDLWLEDFETARG